VCVAVTVLGYECSSASCKLADECCCHFWQPLSIFRFSREQAACRTSAAAVAVSWTVSHRDEFVLQCCLLVQMCEIAKMSSVVTPLCVEQIHRLYGFSKSYVMFCPCDIPSPRNQWLKKG